MNRPTDEQLKEFWEWCGLEHHWTDGNEYFYFPNNQRVFSYPKLDLNNLFKYAVPKLNDFTLSHYPDGYYAHCRIGKTEGTGIDPYAALALFWAIWKVIKSEVKP